MSWTSDEERILRRLDTPGKIQDFLNRLEPHRAREPDTCYSPRLVLRHGRANCVEGAMFAAAALAYHGHPAYLLDLEATKVDLDHVVALFGVPGSLGAISKTNHVVLRYRDPVYRTPRELAMSYFHEYFPESGGACSLRSFARLNLARFDRRSWQTSEEEIWYVPETLAELKHTPLLTAKQIHALRPAERIEVKVGQMKEHPTG